MLSKPSHANAHWPACYDYAVQDGCYKRDPVTGKEVKKNWYVNEQDVVHKTHQQRLRSQCLCLGLPFRVPGDACVIKIMY